MLGLKYGTLAALLVAALIATSTTVRAASGDFTTWTQVQDPADPHLTASAAASQATLVANGGPIPASTDIGYQSINGQTAATSTGGFAFDPGSSFSVAIDYSLSGANQNGTLGIGFGIGEDRDGMNSAGAALLINNGAPLAFGAAARINDGNQTPHVIAVAPSAVGSLFASYDQASGDITLGASATAGASSPTATATYAGIQNFWANQELLASFFLRSDGTLSTPFASGNEQAIFSNFRVLSGAPVSVTPEPGSLVLLAAGMLFARRRRV